MYLLESVKNGADRIYQAMPSMPLSSPQAALRKISKVALPAILLFGAANAPGAEAVLAHAICLAGCTPLLFLDPAAYPVCLLGCAGVPVP